MKSLQMRLMALLLPIVSLILAAGAPALAAYPEQPVKVVVPFAAGGGSDIVVRLVQKHLLAVLPQPTVVINRPGAGGSIGNREVLNAKPDGYTILSTHQGMSVNQVVGMTDFNYTAFEPIAETGVIELVVAVPKASPYKTLDDLLRAARQAPGTVSHATNLNSLTHFAMLGLASEAGADFLYVPAGGGGSRLPLLMGNHVESALLGVAEVMPHYQSGEIRVLAILSAERWPTLPDVPSSKELGLAFAPLSVGYWWFAPKGTPPEAVAVMTNALKVVMTNPDVTKAFGTGGIRPTFVSGEKFREQVQRDHEMIVSLGRKFGVKAQ